MLGIFLLVWFVDRTFPFFFPFIFTNLRCLRFIFHLLAITAMIFAFWCKVLVVLFDSQLQPNWIFFSCAACIAWQSPIDRPPSSHLSIARKFAHHSRRSLLIHLSLVPRRFKSILILPYRFTAWFFSWWEPKIRNITPLRVKKNDLTNFTTLHSPVSHFFQIFLHHQSRCERSSIPEKSSHWPFQSFPFFQSHQSDFAWNRLAYGPFCSCVMLDCTQSIQGFIVRAQRPAHTFKNRLYRQHDFCRDKELFNWPNATPLHWPCRSATLWKSIYIPSNRSFRRVLAALRCFNCLWQS